MSFWSELIVGDRTDVVAAYDDEDQQGSRMVVDLPGMLPGDEHYSLERVTTIAAKLRNIPEPDVINVDVAIAGDGESDALHDVNPEWVTFFSSLDDEVVVKLAEQWRDALAKADQGFEVDTRGLVEQLRDACQLASKDELAALYRWTL